MRMNWAGIKSATGKMRCYIFGGNVQVAPHYVCDDNDEYYPHTDTWTAKTDMIDIGISPVTAIYNKAYLFGAAFKPGGVWTYGKCMEYNPDTYTYKADMTTIRNQGVASTLNNKGYHYCGRYGPPGFAVMDDCVEYDPLSNSWTDKTDTPSPARYYLQGSDIDEKGYIYCGRTAGGSALLDCDEYTPDSWVSKTPVPGPARYYHGATTINDKGYVLYGGNIYLDNDEYDPDSWVSKTNCPSPGRIVPGASSIRDDLYLFAGNPAGGGYMSDTESYNQDTEAWTAKSNVPNPLRFWVGATSINS